MKKSHYHKYNQHFAFRKSYNYVIIIIVLLSVCIGTFIGVGNHPKIKIKYYYNVINQDTTIFGFAIIQYAKNLNCYLIFEKNKYSKWLFVEDIILKRRSDTLFRIPHEDINNLNFPTWPRYKMDSKDTILHPFIILNQQNFKGEQIHNDETSANKSLTPFQDKLINLIRSDSIDARFERKYKLKRNEYVEIGATWMSSPYLIESGKGTVTFNTQTKEYSIKLLPPYRTILIRLDSSMMIKELCCVFDNIKMQGIQLTEDKKITKTDIPLTVDYILQYGLN